MMSNAGHISLHCSILRRNVILTVGVRRSGVTVSKLKKWSVRKVASLEAMIVDRGRTTAPHLIQHAEASVAGDRL
ncbi:hypothetical protein MHYP_G00181850 [Metynnis hypsauchen]